MSHFSRIQTQMVDKDFILMALKDLGYTYQEGDQQISGFGRQKTAVDIRIPLKFSHDIGLRRVGNHYDIIADWAMIPFLRQKDFTEQLTQRYAYHATRAKLEEQGFDMVEEKVETTGEIRIVLRRMA